jgi:hypothetical protein
VNRAQKSIRTDRAEIDKQHSAVLAALDKLFELEVPRWPRPILHLVAPAIEAIDRDPAGEGLRAFIIRRGWDVWAIGGELELFGAMRAVMVARPHRQVWNRHQLSTLWADIGLHERNIA